MKGNVRRVIEGVVGWLFGGVVAASFAEEWEGGKGFVGDDVVVRMLSTGVALSFNGL